MSDKKNGQPDPKQEANRRRKKTVSVRKLAENIQGLRNKVTKDLSSDDEKTRLTALAVALMDKTAERVGNEGSAKDGHFGVTGWQDKHVEVSGNKVTIKYVGKSGVEQEKSFTNEKIAKLLKECKGNCKGKGSPVLSTPDGFKIKADKVNRYLKEFDITAKDIRGYAANDLMATALKGAEISSDRKEREKKFKEAIKSVAEKVGHQQSTLKKHYLLPGIEEQYVGKGKVPKVKEASLYGRVRTIAARVFRAEVKEVGDDTFELVIDPARHIDRSHVWVGKIAAVNANAKEVMSGLHGDEVRIEGVIIKMGQILGLEVGHPNGRTYLAPIKDFYIL